MSWRNHGEIMEKSWRNHGEIMEKSWRNHVFMIITQYYFDIFFYIIMLSMKMSDDLGFYHGFHCVYKNQPGAV